MIKSVGKKVGWVDPSSLQASDLITNKEITDKTKQEGQLSPSTEVSHQPRAEEEVEDVAIPEADSRGRATP